MDAFISAIDKHPDGTIIIVKWKNELNIKCAVNTIYEADNGLDEDEDGYKNFYACLVHIIEILKESIGYPPIEDEDCIYVSVRNPPKEVKKGYYNVKIGDFIEISIENPPIEIKLENGSVIWRR